MKLHLFTFTCHIYVFRDGANFCKAFAKAQVHISHITNAEATSNMTYARVLMQKLFKNCLHLLYFTFVIVVPLRLLVFGITNF